MTEDSAKRGRGRPRDPETDAAILRVALELFTERGVEGASIEQIAKRAGVGKVTVYRRWGSKEDIIAAAIESVRQDIPPPAEDLTLAELLALSLPASAKALAAPGFRALLARIYGSAASHPSIMETYWEHYILPRRAATRTLLEQAQREGVLEPHANLDVLLDMMAGAVMYRVIQPGPSDEQTMRAYLESVYRQAGLLP